MSAVRTVLLALVGTLLAACHVGPQIDETSIGRQPHGATVIVELNEKTGGKRIEHYGELLVVTDDGLVVLTPKNEQINARLIEIPWSKIFRIRAPELPGVAMRASQGDSARAASVEELRLVSRFPQGLSEGLARQLLSYYGQTELGALD